MGDLPWKLKSTKDTWQNQRIKDFKAIPFYDKKSSNGLVIIQCEIGITLPKHIHKVP